MMNTDVLRVSRVIPRAGALVWPWIVAAVVAFALIERALIDTTPDVSWLLTLGEKMLAGERPYVDFIEVNPPVSFYLYLPAILLARISGLSPEFMVGLLVFAGVGAALWFTARVLIKGGILQSTNTWPVAAAFAFVLLVFPAATFAQREHVALIAFLPMLAVSLLRTMNKPVAWHSAMVAGVFAALTVIIKPHFIFPVLFTAATAAVCARSWRPLFALENWISAGLAALYGAWVVLFFPEFIFEWIPIIAAVYVSQKATVVELLTIGPIPFWLVALLVIAALKGRAAFAPPFLLLIAGAAGFLFSFAAQQKGLPYHSYPMLALIYAGAIIALFERAGAMQERVKLLAAAIAIAGLNFGTFSWYTKMPDNRAFAVPIRASVSNPVMLNISGGGLVAMGFPLTRQVNGTWASRTCGQWISAGVLFAKSVGVDPQTSAQLDRYMEFDRTMLLEDIRRAKPDIILADRERYDWYKWALEDARLARELENYRPLEQVNGVLILRRK
jgi:hypothetical protein